MSKKETSTGVFLWINNVRISTYKPVPINGHARPTMVMITLPGREIGFSLEKLENHASLAEFASKRIKR